MSEKKTHGLFPEIEPNKEYELACGDVHKIYVEESGNPNGQPIIFLHGGPGGGCGSKQRRFFDPKHYRIILFDQRGCGKSSPLGEIKENTTKDLVSDIETIRKHLNIEKWILFGGSWGSSLALAYGIKYPKYLIGLILRGVFLSREKELNWFLKDVDQFFPENHELLLSHKDNINRDNLVKEYTDLVFGSNFDIAKQAAVAWNKFEGSILKLLPSSDLNNFDDDINYEFELARAKVQLHYINSSCFIDGNAILNEVKVLKNIPIEIVQGRYDMVCPPKTAYELKKQLPHSELIIIDDAGHSASEDGTLSALISATEKFKALS
ncbi:prolyl aminopeptidase [Methylophilaceae bacterium]|jgi:proline iminopeptidase|nr:prolyl aminopeptidase [Methylophilaceae bacterium]